MSDLLAPAFPGYALLDSGAGRKLERIGHLLVDRPAPPALWRPARDAAAWAAASSRVVRTKDGGGFWEHAGAEPTGFTLDWQAANGRRVGFQIRLTAFGHCGLFFEQEPVWRLLHRTVNELGARLGRPVKGLNLFGYTGAASLAMAAAGAEVYHVDSAKGVLSWGQDSARASDLGGGTVRWVHEDAGTFLAHSRKKGFTYDVILADPPSWGHGTNKQVWRFEEDIQALVSAGRAVLSDPGLLMLSSHTPGVQHHALRNLLAGSGFATVDSGEFVQQHADDPRLLPAGIFAIGRNGLDPLPL
mgnify:CR=1 FL=1